MDLINETLQKISEEERVTRTLVGELDESVYDVPTAGTRVEVHSMPFPSNSYDVNVKIKIGDRKHEKLFRDADEAMEAIDEMKETYDLEEQ